MSETPYSDTPRTRFSTPEPDLDDHRNQQETLPRVETTGPRSRRGTLGSLENLQLPPPGRTAVTQFLTPEIVARDFEQAVVDDDASNKSIKSARSPIVARRSKYRRPTLEGAGGRSRNSSSSRSTSPPNSVDAFADPGRRRRAGTLTSRNGSFVGSIVRTLSTDTRRRPTISDCRSPIILGDAKSIEDDVCFPPEETNKTFTIDFEELDEFVAEYHEKTPAAHPFAAAAPIKLNTVFEDLRCKKNGIESSPSGGISSDLDEKRRSAAGVDDDPTRLEELDTNIDRPPTRAGAPANRWAFFSSEADETIHAPELGGLTMPGEGFRELFELGPEGGVWWLDMTNPSEEEVTVICKAFGVHPLTREDITTQETREKVELFKSYYFVCFRSFWSEDPKHENWLEPVNVYAVVFREGLLTFSFCPNDHAANVRKRIGRLRDYVNLSADWICYALIDEIVDAFAPVIHNIEKESDTIEDQVFITRFDDAQQIMRAIGGCRKSVMQMLRLLGGKADVIKGFAKRCNEQYSVTPRGDVGLYLSDVQDHVVTMMSVLAHVEKMLSRSHSNYLAQISLDNIAQGNQANQLLGKITVIATILVPLNLIAGLFGMNVPVPGKDTDSLAWFFSIIGVILVFSTGCIVAARRMKYI